MITEPRVFENEYLPRELMHREGAVEELTRALHPTIHGLPARDVLISGPSGVGKTVLARYGLARLQDAADVDSALVRCLGLPTGEFLRTVLRGYRGGDDVPQNTPVDQIREQLGDVVDEPYILVLDEADGIPESSTLELLADLPTLSLVVICHEPEQWLARAPEDVRRGIGGHIELDRYGVDELADILQARVDEGLLPNVVRQDQLRTIADEVAGVARFGIQSLRAAAELAGEHGHSKILDEDVRDSFDRARRRIRDANLKSLPFHHHVLYALLQDVGELDASELHRRYDEIAEDLYYGRDLMPIGKRSRRNKLAKLVEYDLIGAEGEPQNRVYTVLDPSIESPLDLAVCV